MLKKAQNIETIMIRMNWFQGKKNTNGICVNTTYCSTIVNPTMKPIITPSRQLAITRVKAS